MAKNRYPLLPGSRPPIDATLVSGWWKELFGSIESVPTTPDTNVLIPDAAQLIQVDRAMKFQVDLPAAPIADPRDGLIDWQIDTLFTGLEANPPWNAGFAPPMSDWFSLAFTATLCRIAYSGNLDAVATLGFAFKELNYAHFQAVDNPLVKFDLWSYKGRMAIVVFPGTVALSQWLYYALPQLVPFSAGPTGVKAYAGIRAQLTPYMTSLDTQLLTYLTRTRSIITCGHSVGGAIAQMYAALKFNTDSDNDYPSTGNTPIVAQYSFGAPAWVSYSGDLYATRAFRGHCRVYSVGDPVVNATQLWMSKSAGLARQVVPNSSYFPLANPTTRWVHDRQINTTNPSEGMANRLWSTAFNALLQPGLALAEIVAARHAIATYARCCLANAKADKLCPLRYFDAVSKANDQLDAAGV